MAQKACSSEETSRSFSFRWQIGLAFFVFSVIGAQDSAIGVLIPAISSHYGVGKGIVSLLLLWSSAGYLIAAFNSGFLMKQLGQRRFLLLGVSAIIVGAFSISIVPPFAVLMLSFFFTGLGIAALDIGLNVYIAVLPRSTTLLNYLHAFYGVGALFGPIIVSTVLEIGLSWNYVYSHWIFLSLFFFFGVILAFKKPEAASDAQSQDEAQEKTSSMANVLHLPVTWIVTLFLFSYLGTEVSLGTWIYSFLTEQRQQPTLFSAWIVSSYWMGLTLGRIVLAKLVSWLTERVAIQICVIGTLLGILLTWLIPIDIVSAIGLCLTGFCLGPIFPTTIALMPRLFSQRLLATAIGLVTSLSGLGRVFFPWLSGNLAQAFGLWIILPFALALTVMMFTLWMLLQLPHNL
jgi:fucose permease